MERLTLNKMQRLAGHRRALQDVQPRLVLPGGFVNKSEMKQSKGDAQDRAIMTP